MQSVVRLLSLSAASAALLAGCGGGVSFHVGDDDGSPFWDFFFTGRTAELAVDATDDRLDGTWSTPDTEVTQVARFGATAQQPETCRFQFYALRQQGEFRFLDGEVRYAADTGAPRTVFIGIGPRVYRLDEGRWLLNHTTQRVVFRGAVAQSTSVPGESITLTGFVPLPERRAAGC